MTKQPMATITEMLEEKEQERRKEVRKASTKRRQMVQLLEEHVFPTMPRSLAACYRLGYVSSGYFDAPSADLTFKPVVDMHDDTKAKQALGTIAKVVTGLEKAGWDILRRPEARNDGYNKSMSVLVGARRQGDKGREWLNVTFDGIYATEHCQLVEKEVIVAAVAEHTEKKMVVECDD